MDDPRQRRPDIGLAKSLLDWQPTVALREGLAATIAGFREELWLAAPVAERLS
jgi:UDP-glucuronate decarboxylase